MPRRKPTSIVLSQRELDIMSVLWDLREATVSAVRDRVDPDLAYTTVSTMIRLLELKGYVSHRRGDGKTHVYRPVVDREAAGGSVLRRVVQKLYGGSPIKLLAQLVEQEKLSAADVARMRALLDGARKRP